MLLAQLFLAISSIAINPTQNVTTTQYLNKANISSDSLFRELERLDFDDRIVQSASIAHSKDERAHLLLLNFRNGGFITIEPSSKNIYYYNYLFQFEEEGFYISNKCDTNAEVFLNKHDASSYKSNIARYAPMNNVINRDNMIRYFENLYDNIGYNINDSCSYVATQVMFNFLDAFITDDIIPEEYDELGESLSSTFDLDRLIDSSGSSEEYHQFLIREIGLKNGFISQENYDKKDFGLDYYNTNQFTNKVIDFLNSRNIKTQTVSSFPWDWDKIGKNKMRNMVRDGLNKGVPVCLFLNGHVIVGYKIVGDTIYAHNGYTLDNLATYQLKEVVGMWYVDNVDVPYERNHKHSNNIDTPDSQYRLCYCGERSEEWKIDIHSHQFYYKWLNSNQHAVYCYGCSYNMTALHNKNLGIKDPCPCGD